MVSKTDRSKNFKNHLRKDLWTEDSTSITRHLALKNFHLSASQISKLPELKSEVEARGMSAVIRKVIKIRGQDFTKRRSRMKNPRYNIQQITIGGDLISLPYISCLDPINEE